MCLHMSCVMAGGSGVNDLVPRAESHGFEKSGQGHRLQPGLLMPGPPVSEITALAAKSSSLGAV